MVLSGYRNAEDPQIVDRKIAEKCIGARRVQLVYQPKWEPGQNEVTGVEALIRWNNAEFIPFVESSGMIHEVEWIMHEACRQFKIWQDDQENLLMRIVINISGAQLLHPQFL